MMSGRAINYEQASTYYEHSADYYTGHQSHYDKWHGKLAKRLKLTGELSKGEFEIFCQNIAAEERRKRIGFDATFSAPKSVSLALAESDERREELIRIHKIAVERVLAEIEKNHLRTRSNRKKLLARNMACGEFVHFLNRNNELDLHSHCVILNQTDTDGKILALDFDKLLEHQKMLGLIYRQELAHELLTAGYELEVTNSREGYFELKGFDRETVMAHSTRRQEILAEAESQGAMTAQGKMLANLATRKAKDKSIRYEDVLAEVKQSLYDTEKIKIECHRKEQEQNGRLGRRDDGRGGSFAGRGAEGEKADGRNGGVAQYEHSETPAGQSGFADTFEDWSEIPQSIAQGYGLPELPQFPLDVPARRSRLLLPSDTIRHLASLQTEKEYHLAMQRAQRQERRRRIDEIAKTAVEHLSREAFAFSIPEVCHRIMAEGVLERISQKEAQAAMERLKLVKLGRMERGKNRKDVYVTTEANIRQEYDIIERMQKGKGVIPKTLSMEQSKELLNRVATEEKLTPNEEQTAVLHHIMTSADRFLCVQGLAGTGKTYTMNALRKLCEAEDIKVRGVCFTGKAADGLKKESGIPSSTIHSFLGKLEKESGIKVERNGEDGIRQHWDFSQVKPTQEREIWIVDEAGLVDNHLMDELQQAAIAYNAQVVFSGDYAQLPPVGAGEPFKALIEAGAGTAYLEDIRRQKDLELLEAVRQSVKGDTLKTYEILEKRGDFREIGDRDDRRCEIRHIMGQTRLEDYKNQLLLVSTNGSRKEYNDKIRRDYIRTGQLEEGTTFKITSHNGEKDVTEERRFARRDRIIFTANNSRLGVLNGTMGQIEAIQGSVFTVRTDSGEQVTFDMEQYNSIDYSYAVTNYKAQGMGVDFVVADMPTTGRGQNRNAAYVDLSRAKQRAIVFTDNKERLEKQTREFVKKVSSRDFSKRIQKMVQRGYVANNERYHVPEKKSIGELLASVKWKPLDERVLDMGQTDERQSQPTQESKSSRTVSYRRSKWDEERSESMRR